MFIEALFTVAKTMKKLKCPLAYEWIKMWDIYTMQYYSAIKTNKTMPFAATWTLALSEVRKRKTNTT